MEFPDTLLILKYKTEGGNWKAVCTSKVDFEIEDIKTIKVKVDLKHILQKAREFLKLRKDKDNGF